MRVLRAFAGRNRLLLIVVAVVTCAAIAGVGVLALSGGTDDPASPDVTTRPGASEQSSALTPTTHESTPTSPSSTQRSAQAPVILGSDPRDSHIAGGITDHLLFAGKVTEALLAYGPRTDFAFRNSDLMQLALPEPWGNPPALQTDLARYTPAGPALAQLRRDGTTVTWKQTSATVSQWAEQRIRDLGGPSGAHAVNVAGVQTIRSRGAAPVQVPVTVSMTVVCGPTVPECGLDRIYSGPIEQALGGTR